MNSNVIDLIVAITSLIPTIVSVVILIINIIKNKNWTLVMNIADAAMREVEKYAKEHPEMTSDEKLEMALKATEEGLKVAGIKLDTDLIKRIVEYIKQSIGWHNEMNGRQA